MQEPTASWAALAPGTRNDRATSGTHPAAVTGEALPGSSTLEPVNKTDGGERKSINAEH